METEPVRINKELMNRLRKYVSLKTEGRMYGEIGTTVEEALKEHLDRQSEFEISLNRFKSYFRPLFWTKISELKKFDQIIQSIRTNVSIIEGIDRPDIEISPEEIGKSVDEIKMSIIELEALLPKDYKEKHFKIFKDSINKIIGKIRRS